MFLAATEIDSGTIFSLLFAIVSLVGAWIGWARWQAKQASDTHAVSTGTLRDVITLLTDGQKELRSELAALRVVQSTQTEEIATLKEKVRQLEGERDQLRAENASQKAEIVALNVRIVEMRAEIVRLTGDLADAESDASEQALINERLNERLKAYDNAAAKVVPPVVKP